MRVTAAAAAASPATWAPASRSRSTNWASSDRAGGVERGQDADDRQLAALLRGQQEQRVGGHVADAGDEHEPRAAARHAQRPPRSRRRAATTSTTEADRRGHERREPGGRAGLVQQHEEQPERRAGHQRGHQGGRARRRSEASPSSAATRTTATSANAMPSVVTTVEPVTERQADEHRDGGRGTAVTGATTLMTPRGQGPVEDDQAGRTGECRPPRPSSRSAGRSRPPSQGNSASSDDQPGDLRERHDRERRRPPRGQAAAGSPPRRRRRPSTSASSTATPTSRGCGPARSGVPSRL